MRKNFGPNPWLYPMPVLIIGSYDENNVPNAMNAAWGGISEGDEISICVSEGHKTTKNIIAKKLKDLRKSKNMSQSNLAAKLQTMNINVDQQMISKIEKNNRQVTDYELVCICKCLSVTPNDLLNFFELKF